MVATTPMTGMVASNRPRTKRPTDDACTEAGAYFFSMFQNTGTGPATMPETLLRNA